MSEELASHFVDTGNAGYEFAVWTRDGVNIIEVTELGYCGSSRSGHQFYNVSPESLRKIGEVFFKAADSIDSGEIEKRKY